MAGKQATPAAPRGLKAAGRRLWDSTCADFELEPFEASLLEQACRTADIIETLQSVVDSLGVDCAGRELAEVRQQRLAFARILVALRLPAGLDDEPGRARRPQRRGIRGVYSMGGA